jgi:tetratricopeptide (TPR) repeat protein
MIAAPPAGPRGSRPGVDPVRDVTVMENHDAAYYAWEKAGVKRRVVVHVDAHHDLWFIRDAVPMTIANFLCPALTQNFIREIFWIVPDPTWETAGDRAEIIHQVRALAGKYPGGGRTLSVTDQRVATSLLGRPLTVGPLAALRGFQEPVLLDLDTDYLVLPHVYGESDAHRALPWCWPGELLERLRALGVLTDLVTIAYSVEGGYTPLKWKYLGDELAARLRSDAEAVEGFERLRRTIVAEGPVRRADALTALLDTDARLAGHPAPHYFLSQFYADDHRFAEARDAYQRAVRLDATYRTQYRNSGFRYFAEKRYDEAEGEHRRGLAIDPDDTAAHFGLGRLAARRRQWPEAEQLLRRALTLDHSFVDTYRALGEVLAGQRRYAEAIDAYEHSLRLSLAGGKTLDSVVATDAAAIRLNDPNHFEVFAQVGQLQARLGQTGEAINSFRLGIAGQHDNPHVRWALSRLYATRREWRASAWHLWHAARLSPGELRRPVQRAWHRLKRRARNLRAASRQPNTVAAHA